MTQFEAGRVILPMSRLVCDVDRFPLDEQESMVARGMGRVGGRGVIESGEDALGGHWGREVCMIGTVSASPRHRNAPKRHVLRS
jgi:hypothetical protein